MTTYVATDAIGEIIRSIPASGATRIPKGICNFQQGRAMEIWKHLTDATIPITKKKPVWSFGGGSNKAGAGQANPGAGNNKMSQNENVSGSGSGSAEKQELTPPEID
ncbi:hypothetical protein KEM55_006802 [Ascosphaera atra]|nr:hypothetical protein KEM55_006802 [Ascosphaera atra]